MPARKAEDFLLDMVSLLEDHGKRSGYISNILKAAKSWFKFNRKHIEVDIKLRRETGVYVQEKTPATPELRRILDAADTRQKVAISLMAFSGFREETLGDYLGVEMRVIDKRNVKGGNVDPRLISEAYRLLLIEKKGPANLVLVSGDRDYEALLADYEREGRKVTVCFYLPVGGSASIDLLSVSGVEFIAFKNPKQSWSIP